MKRSTRSYLLFLGYALICRHPMLTLAQTPDTTAPLSPGADASSVTPTPPAAVSPGAAPPPITDIHDIKPALEIGMALNWHIYALIAAVLLLLVGLLVYGLKRRRAKIHEADMAPLPPEETAYQLLDDLKEVDQFDAKTFYFQLSAILRGYIEGRYGINAQEMTTEELLSRMDQLALDSHLERGLRDFLIHTDPIKFADMPAAKTRMEKDLGFAHTFVKKTTGSTASGTDEQSPVAPMASKEPHLPQPPPIPRHPVPPAGGGPRG